MTVASNTPYDQYSASNGQTIFTYNFEIVLNTDLLVYQRGQSESPNDVTQLLTLTTDYTVTGVGNENGGTIVLVSGATTGDIITVKQNVPVERDTSFTPGGILKAQDLNAEYDNQCLIDQVSRFNEAHRMLSYWNSAVVVDLVDTIIPVLPASSTWWKNENDDEIIPYSLPAGGAAPAAGTYVTLTDETALLPDSFPLDAIGGGLMVNVPGTPAIITRTLTGTLNQVDIANTTGLTGNPIFSLSATLDFPGTFTVQGTTDIDAIINDSSMGTATATNLSTSAAIKAYVDGLDAGNVKSVSGTLNRITSTGGANPVIDISASYVGQSSITTLGTITTGVWHGTVISPTYGGTGVNNGSNTLTLAGALETVGAHAVTFTFTGATGVTFPTSGTLATVGATVSSITGTANQITASAPTGAVTLAIASNPVIPGTGGMTLPTGTTAQQAGIAGTIRFNSQTSVFESTDDGATWNAFSSGGGSVLSVSGTANQVEVDNTNPNTPIVLLPNVLDIPGTFNIQGSTAVDEIINDNSMATATATNLATALSIKTYVDSIAAGFHLVNPVRVATTAALTGTYANGTAGVGATFTMTALGAASIDGVSLALNDRVLIKNQASTFQNGVYYVSTVGNGGAAAVYTRTTDFDTPAEINPGDLIPVLEGSTNQYTMWLQTATVTTIGVDAITFVQFGASFANVVTITGTQTITGDKTFSGLVAVPTPTTGTGAANKNYVDASNNYSYLLMGG